MQALSFFLLKHWKLWTHRPILCSFLKTFHGIHLFIGHSGLVWFGLVRFVHSVSVITKLLKGSLKTAAKLWAKNRSQLWQFTIQELKAKVSWSPDATSRFVTLRTSCRFRSLLFRMYKATSSFTPASIRLLDSCICSFTDFILVILFSCYFLCPLCVLYWCFRWLFVSALISTREGNSYQKNKDFVIWFFKTTAWTHHVPMTILHLYFF